LIASIVERHVRTTVSQKGTFPEQELLGSIPNYIFSKALFGTRVLVGFSEDNPDQTSNPHSFLKICLVLEYWTSLISANPHFSPNFSVFLSISNTLPLPSGLWVGFCGDWVKVEVSPNTLGDYSH
jgi:hypothetical protein